MYWEGSGRIFKLKNNFLHDSVFLQPIMFLPHNLLFAYFYLSVRIVLSVLLPQYITDIRRLQVAELSVHAVPALANAGPNCDPCADLQKVIVQSTKRTNVWQDNFKLTHFTPVVSHCIFLNITNARIPHERGARLRQIGPFGLKQTPSTGLGYGLDDRGIVLESRRQKRFSVQQSVQTGLGAHPASCFQWIPTALAPKVTHPSCYDIQNVNIHLLLYIFAWLFSIRWQILKSWAQENNIVLQKVIFVAGFRWTLSREGILGSGRLVPWILSSYWVETAWRPSRCPS
jgi:hypothetical protein